jgi:murein DD-endopeptidase MepM/ murein hydrolase activator NlpD
MGFYNGYHSWAIDIPNSVGTPIFAADSGRIIEAQYGYNGGYGNTILIDHGDGYQTRYAHMSSLAIIGGYVSKGQVIGYMGSTGRSTGAHLHFEIILNGSRQNPINFF